METFLKILQNAILKKEIVKISLSKPVKKNNELRNIYIKPVILKGKYLFSFTFHYERHDEVKNYDDQSTFDTIKSYFGTVFYNIHLNTLSVDTCAMLNKKGKCSIVNKKVSEKRDVNTNHDHIKKRLIDIQNPWWRNLGLATKDGHVVSVMQHKYKQICKYVELLDGIIKKTNLGQETICIADMGAGKGYLTFALYEYLTYRCNYNIDLVGVERRKDLVDKLNEIVTEYNMSKIKFIKGCIEDYNPPKIDMVVALHACNTATDDAIIKGIHHRSKVILCAPCCHKQIREDMEKSKVIDSITRFGIFLERQAVLITDAIRTLILEYYGYKTQVIEFVETEHTPKNILIIAVQSNYQPTEEFKKSIIEQIEKLKKQYGITKHYLEKVFDEVQYH